MNFIGHIALARGLSTDAPDRADDTVAFLAGSALPDFASMGRFRLRRNAGAPPVATGVDFHHRTDAAFHGHPWFNANDRAVGRRLSDAGLNRGAALACGHVGVELLLDGLLLDRDPALMTATRSSLAALTDESLELSELVEPEHRDRWARHLNRLSQWEPPEDYRDPAAVAARLQQILQRRPRLAFDSSQVPVVADALARQQPTLEAGSDQLLDDLRAELATPT